MISPGDLVIVVRPTPCCGRSDSFGSVFVVSEIERAVCECGFCGKFHSGVFAQRGDKPDDWYLMSQLRKVPPLKDDEQVHHNEEATA